MNCSIDHKKRPISSRLSLRLSEIKQKRQNVAINELSMKSSCADNCDLLIECSQKPIGNATSKVDEKFFFQPCIVLAKALLGKILVRKLPTGEILRGRIVETESYLGNDDKASHSYQGKETKRNEAMFLSPGTAYVYSIYGMYYCFNISSLEDGSAVLIRALEPIEGLSTMRELRSIKRNNSALKDKDLCNGPSKLCQALSIEKALLNKTDLTRSDDLWIERDLIAHEFKIICCKRIGIDSCGDEWANKPLRFYIRDCKYVSIRNKTAENEQQC
ncbi:uncharacterized protein LOC129226543 [Uloborus diversus]|uniref:uncharacterized protein LOC129226543 n=1 Tax=Uloborus diversus TaxID=327109 RepID=UPI002408FC6E|nr:uncharacterized protein LOC129226543 [Uloborus diversus]